VATIVSGPENTKLGAWTNTTPAIIVNVQRQPGANIIQVVDRIQALAAANHVDAATGNGRPRDKRPHRDHPRFQSQTWKFELGLAVVLVVLVIFVFLRTLPGTIIPSLSVPLSLVGTFGGRCICSAFPSTICR